MNQFVLPYLTAKPEILTREIARRIADPGSVLPRGDDFKEPIPSWGARAIATMFQPIEASDGSAQPVEPSVLVSLVAIAKETHPRINPNSSPAECRERDELIRQAESARGIGEVRDLFNAAKGVSPDQLELQLARGHLREASRAFEALRAENNQLRNYLRVAGDLLGRADADPIKLAAKVEAGIIAKGEEISGLEAEADKARRVIAGNTDIKDNGSLLDMLNELLNKTNDAIALVALVRDRRDKAEAEVERWKTWAEYAKAQYAEATGGKDLQAAQG